MKRLCLQIAELKAGFRLNTEVEIQGLVKCVVMWYLIVQKNREVGEHLLTNYHVPGTMLDDL